MKSLTIFMIVTALSTAVAAAVKPVDLKCDYRSTPLAVDRQDPVLSWRIDGDRQGLTQQEYQIQAASSVAKLKAPDLWDTGWIKGEYSMGIEYAGKPFAAKQRVFWLVRVKDEKGAVFQWSAPSWFEGGLQKDSEWKNAKWISCTRTIQDEIAPAEVRGDWIAAGTETKAADKITYSYNFSLPEKVVVYTGAW